MHNNFACRRGRNQPLQIYAGETQCRTPYCRACLHNFFNYLPVRGYFRTLLIISYTWGKMGGNKIQCLLHAAINALLGGVLGFAGCVNFIEIEFLNHIFYNSSFYPSSGIMRTIFALCGSFLMLMLFVFFVRKRQSAYGDETELFFTSASLPVAILGVFFFPLPPGFWVPILFTIIISWWAYRLCLLLEWRNFSELKIPGYVIILTLAGLFILAAGYGFFMQRKALSIMYLTFYDWGEFVTIAKNTLDGKWFITNDSLPGVNYMGRHFAPGSILLIALYLKIFPSLDAFFFFNSALLYCMPPLIYWLARKCDLSVPVSLVLSIVTFLSPSLI